jgi:predicted nucleotidyltransferase
MKTRDEILEIVQSFAEQLREALGDTLNSVILFGSYARGDYEEGSDVDVMVLLNVEREDVPQYREPIRNIARVLDWDNEILLSTVSQSAKLFNYWKDDLPFYHNVITEGVRISA